MTFEGSNVKFNKLHLIDKILLLNLALYLAIKMITKKKKDDKTSLVSDITQILVLTSIIINYQSSFFYYVCL